MSWSLGHSLSAFMKWPVKTPLFIFLAVSLLKGTVNIYIYTNVQCLHKVFATSHTVTLQWNHALVNGKVKTKNKIEKNINKKENKEKQIML